MARAPELILSVLRASLLDEAAGRAFPLRREWVRKESAPTSSQQLALAVPQTNASPKTQPQTSSHGKSRTASQGEQPAQPQDQLVKEPAGAAAPHWRRLERAGDVAVFENVRALPRAWLATGALVVGEEQMLEVIRTGRVPGGEAWEPRRTALMEAPIDFKQTAGDDASAHAEVTKHEANRVEVRAAAGVASILVLSESHFPGWRVYVDGRAAETLRVDYNLRGVALPAGEHTVEFVYRPKSVLYGLLVSLLTLAALIIWAAAIVPESLTRRRRQHR